MLVFESPPERWSAATGGRLSYKGVSCWNFGPAVAIASPNLPDKSPTWHLVYSPELKMPGVHVYPPTRPKAVQLGDL